MRKKVLLLMTVSTLAGFICGIYFPQYTLTLRLLDKLFIDLLKLIIIPLTFFSIVSSIISMGNIKRFKSIWIYTTSYIIVSMLISLLIAMTLSTIFKPGNGVLANHIFVKVSYNDLESLQIMSFIDHIIPRKLLEVTGKMELLPVVIFSVIFSTACIAAGKAASPVTNVILGMRHIFNHMITWLIYLTPIALFSILGSALAHAFSNNTIANSMNGIMMFIVAYFIGLLCQVFMQIVIIKFILNKNPIHFFVSASSALLTAFSASNTIATLPTTLMTAKEAKISDEAANFVLPYTSIMNLTGSIMYEGMAALFFCQIVGMQLSIVSQLHILMIAIIAGFGAKGIPESGSITMPIILRGVGVPTSAGAILLPFENLLYRFCSVVTVSGDLVCAAMVDNFLKKKSNTHALVEMNQRQLNYKYKSRMQAMPQLKQEVDAVYKIIRN